MGSLKQQSKVIGWDDGPFEFEGEEPVPLVGVVMRGGNFVEGIIKTSVNVDGLKGTERLIDAINRSKHREDLGLILLDGITVAGFNVIDIEKLRNETGIPVLALSRKKPDLDAFRKAMNKVTDSERRWKAAKKAGEFRTTAQKGKKIYYQISGLSEGEAERAISITSTHSILPEPVRLANMIAKSLKYGES